MNSVKSKLNSGDEGKGVVLFEPTTPASSLLENGEAATDHDGRRRDRSWISNGVRIWGCTPARDLLPMFCCGGLAELCWYQTSGVWWNGI
ncbi:hypothetical protein ABKV19_003689 [Rosa sericea]